MKRPALGRYIEAHGDRLRVVVTVPPSLRQTLGKNKLKQSLPAGTTARQAEALKWPVIAKLKGIVKEAKERGKGKGLAVEALGLREERRREIPQPIYDGKEIIDYDTPVADYIVRRAEQLEETKGLDVAKGFADIAFGRATPLDAYLTQMCERGRYSIGYRQDLRRALDRLEAWCDLQGHPPTVEAISHQVASAYVHETYILTNVHHVTANKDISALSAYWRKALKLHMGARANPWAEQRVDKPDARHGVETGSKRPFTSDEVVSLLNGLALRRDWDASIIAALSGMREDEIASLQVGDCVDGVFNIRRAKTRAGVRKVPVHPALTAIVASRSAGKPDTSFLFSELPDQKPGSKRGRGSPIAQSFTRERRRLKVDERVEGQRQANIDFHSWRRWFVRTAIDALHGGATGFDVWTIANVVGHRSEGAEIEGVKLPLGMTMGRYAGPSKPEALKACVEAVRLPSGAPVARDDLLQRQVAGRRRVGT